MTDAATALSPLHPDLPTEAGDRRTWARLHGASPALALLHAARLRTGPVVAVAPDTASATRLETELRFFAGDDGPEILALPDWETLPYDLFSPHQDIVSQRLLSLYRLPQAHDALLVVPVATLMQRLPPRGHLERTALLLATGDRLPLEAMRARLTEAGYRNVAQVMEHGEFAVRGSLLDLFPMGSTQPLRIDLFDEEVESLRWFDAETQRSGERIERLQLLPAREFPLTDDGIRTFRQAWRQAIEGDPQRSPVYRDVSQGHAPGGIEYYLPLFFDETATLFDYLPAATLFVRLDGATEAAAAFTDQVGERYELRRHDPERPLLPPERLFLTPDEVNAGIRRHPSVQMQAVETRHAPARGYVNFATHLLPPLAIQAQTSTPAAALQRFLDAFDGRVLFAAESAGRREVLRDLLDGWGIRTQDCDGWNAFFAGTARLAIAIAPLERGLLLEQPALAVITENQLFGEHPVQRRRARPSRDPDQIIRDLTELQEGSPVVHEEHGVGRYLGLSTLTIDGIDTEFLTLEYAGKDRIYVPVGALHLISRYSGAEPDKAPLHKLGSGQWERIRRKAAEKVRDVAAELLDLHARRAARPGHSFHFDEAEYRAFSAAFPYEETPDQHAAIEAVLGDMRSGRPMDRVVCGDVGFGKTEVAMRAAYACVHGGRQVALLVPTTLLAQQHYDTFRDRFADNPIRIEVLSRFRTAKEQRATLAATAAGKVDILIGTHRLLQDDVHFKEIGLVIVDEEHRFGVRHKERIKQLRAEVDMLTLTATPIPRTLNMSLAGMRDLSLITTPPKDRLAVKTIVCEWDRTMIAESCQRELKRGGQIYFLHNSVETIEQMARKIGEIVPEATIRIAHGQMHERELEQVMFDFHHRRFQILVCTTIVESGIDVPTANTIIINRADRLGLAQLHQLRGRVGRSHHRAYAYLITPDRRSITADAARRLEAIESLEELGSGFLLATHDLEIRGAGELLGEGQSGQIQEVGFTLYMEMLERAVKALREGREPDLDRPLHAGPEVNLRAPALLPEDYLPDVNLRLTLYKRIANAADPEALRELQVEMIDRFGLLPDATRTLFRSAELKLCAEPLGIRKIEAGPDGGQLTFVEGADIDMGRLIELIQREPKVYRLIDGSRLRFTRPMADVGVRLETVAALLDTLSPSRAD